MRENRIKRALKAGEKTSGAWLQMCSPVAAEIMGGAGFDWILIDMEHGPGDFQTLMYQLQAMSAFDTIPLVRAPWNDHVAIKRILDVGAYGVMIPWVNEGEQCEAAVQACKYPPRGVRGTAGPVRAASFGRDWKEYLPSANDEIMVIVQMETITAVNNIEEILSVDGVDVLFVGPSDLSSSMDHVGDMKHPEVQDAILRVELAAKARGIPLGTVSTSFEQAKELYERGYQFITLCADSSLMVQGSSLMVKRFNDEIG
jgi:2-dehydro-3-deoxyglucarate aldolase/4-hydroxy-2-oxoheptanedioate aldolase